ncbi:MAG TPA: LacI family DNA-binding transcriptional regulator [Acidimicrobiales bacterium]|nr:LacI family DNA-binding transcriptional regulator [Acidimicrobiales bacterium]
MSPRAEQRDRRATLRDVARLADVHVTTASRALDSQRASSVSAGTAERVKRAAKVLDYRPHELARNLRRGRTGTVGVVVPDLTNSHFAFVVRGVADGLEANGLVTVVTESGDDRARFNRLLDHLGDGRVDGIVMAAAREGDGARLERYARAVVPVVLAVRTFRGTRLPSVYTEDRLGGALAARHLLELGHRRIAQVPGPERISPFRARSRGFVDTMRQAGLAVHGTALGAVAPTREEGERLTGELLSRSKRARPTAVFAANDSMAVGALAAINRRGLRCPDDISVVGYNDNAFAALMSPPLTTVRAANYEVGFRSAEILQAVLQGEVVPRVSTFDPVLVVRSSTAAPASER